MATLSVVIPVFKAELILVELVKRLKPVLMKISSNFEIIFVDDCGNDKSWAIISDMSKKDERIKGIKFSRNFGQHYALTAGLDYAKGDWVVMMDCDLQDRPEDLIKLYNKAKEGFDVVLARRISRDDSIVNAITSRIFYKVISYLTGAEYDPAVGTLRIMSRKVVRNFTSMREQLRFVGGLFQWMGFNTTFIDVDRSNRHSGKTTYTFRKRMNLAISAIVSFSDKPLLISIKFGFLMSLASVMFAAYLIYRKIFEDIPVEGWTSVMVSLYLLSGLIIMILGMLGMYIGKVFDQTKNRPLYIIDETTFNNE